MALFTKQPEKALTRDRDLAKANCDRLAVKLTESEAAIISAKTAAQRAALDGDDGGLDKLEAAERAALHRHGTLAAAHTEAGKLLALLESQIAEMLDKKTRAETSVATLALADELTEAADAYAASTEALHAVCAKALTVTVEARGLETFMASSLVEVGLAIPVVAECLKQHSRSVLNHQAPAALPKPAPEPAKPVAAAPKAPTTRVFSTKPIKWLDQDGKQVSGANASISICRSRSPSAPWLAGPASSSITRRARVISAGGRATIRSMCASIWILPRLLYLARKRPLFIRRSRRSIAASRSRSRSRVPRNDPHQIRTADRRYRAPFRIIRVVALDL
jgi:hypothetical protein